MREALDLARLSDALKLLDEGVAMPQSKTAATPDKVKEKPIEKVEPVTEGDLSEIDPASIEV